MKCQCKEPAAKCVAFFFVEAKWITAMADGSQFVTFGIARGFGLISQAYQAYRTDISIL